MSFHALAWAAKSKVTRASDKLILLAFADRHNEETGLAYPSLAWLCEFSSLDRKTVIGSIERLIAGGFITDSGKRTGATKQIKVYTVNVGTVPVSEPSQKRNSTVSSGEQSQKRNTEPVRNLSSSSEAKASSESPAPKSPSKATAFDRFWSSYPAKVGKGAARPAFDRAVRKIGPGAIDVLLEGVRRAATSRKWREGIIPNPATWLNQERWLDEPEGPVRATAPPVEVTPEIHRQRLLHLKETNEWRESWGPRPERSAA